MRKRMTREEAKSLYRIRPDTQINMDFNTWLIYWSIILEDGYSENTSRNAYDTFTESTSTDYCNSLSSSYSSDSCSSSSSSCD